MWTNTCCSHPLAVKGEMVQEQQLGVRRAASRKLLHELGVPLEQSEVDSFVYITRIHYLAPSDGMWGEHEMDYILFATLDVTLDPSPNEVSEVRYVSKVELEELFADPSNSFTPWFKLIANSFLYKWWDALLAGSSISSLSPTPTIPSSPAPLENGHANGVTGVNGHATLEKEVSEKGRVDVEVVRKLVDANPKERDLIHRMLD